MKLNEEPQQKKFEYDLHNPEHKQVIREFEVELENLKSESLEQPLHYYGEPKEVIPAFEMGSRKFPESKNPRRVCNDILGLTDAGIVQHLLKLKAISRRYVNKEHPGRSWAVGPDLKAYEEFHQKKRALDELEDRRTYAKEMENESFNALAESRATIIKSITPK